MMGILLRLPEDSHTCPGAYFQQLFPSPMPGIATFTSPAPARMLLSGDGEAARRAGLLKAFLAQLSLVSR